MNRAGKTLVFRMRADPDLPTLDDIERAYIEFVVSAMDGNKAKAAKKLGIARWTLWDRRRRYEAHE